MENKKYLTCLIYSNSISAGQNKLKEIIKLKEEIGIKVIKKSSWYNARTVEFEDCEIWKNFTTESSIGVRWDKVWIDKNISLGEYQDIVLPGCFSEEAYMFGMKFFNGGDYE
jgi:hypothetical protein